MRAIVVFLSVLSLFFVACQSKKNLEDKITHSLSKIDRKNIEYKQLEENKSLFSYPENFETLIDQNENNDLPVSMKNCLLEKKNPLASISENNCSKD